MFVARACQDEMRDTAGCRFEVHAFPSLTLLSSHTPHLPPAATPPSAPCKHARTIQLYQPGSFHSVHLGDTFHNNRYVIEHKLGHGVFSPTVWVARNLHLHVNRLVVLKRCSLPERRLGLSAGYSDSPPPLSRSSSTSSLTPPSSSRFPTMLDEFIITGPNGSHRCVVREVLGPSLSVCMYGEEIQNLDSERKVGKSRQTTKQKVVDHKWVFKIKPMVDGSMDRFTARLVGKGFTDSTTRKPPPLWYRTILSASSSR